MIYIDTNYVTQCRYLCNTVSHIKISFLLHVHKFRMTRMSVERKWIDMHGNKKSDLNVLHFSHKYRISTNNHAARLVRTSL
jgi:hypothetical protein